MDKELIFEVIPVLTIVIGIGLSFISYTIKIQQDLNKMNKKLNKICEQMGIEDELNKEVNEDIRELILKGKNTKAIKLYRKYTGEGLLESKNYIDDLERKIKEEN